jgi:hypothetical protein
MNKENDKKLIRENIVSKIESGEIEMRSKSYFILKSFLVFGSLFLFFLFALYIGSLVVFVLRVNNILFFYGIGFHGIKTVIFSFPWYLVLLSLILIIFLEIIGKNFRVVYQKPLIYSLIVIMILSFTGSILVDSFAMHDSLFKMAKEERLPVGGRMYRNLGNLDIENAYFGEILEKENNNWTMRLENNKIVLLKVTNETRGKRVFEEIEEGSEVIVIGELENEEINVLGFRRINGNRRNER